jgi:hypothetical protein
MPPKADRLVLTGAAAMATLLGTVPFAGAGPRGDRGASEDAVAPVRYDRDIRPLLSDRCFKCHGPDAGSRQAGLRLDRFDGATEERDGVRAIVPGELDASELWRRVTSEADAERMPPPSSNEHRLSDGELDLVRRWIEQGAPYEEHWSFVPPQRPAVPDVADAAWPRGEIDRFVLAELERRGIAPSPEAEPDTLLRRVFLDLTGLPPTLAELDAYLADTRADRYERWVGKLLREEPYVRRHAERMAVPWLDAARFADTSGIHMDAGRSIWAWRDWVLAAFRDNKPFDEFVVEQLAGDLLPDATVDQRVATGFLRNHVTSDEGGAIDEEYRVEYAVDRAATTGSVFLGLTLGCARCHEHKFDPISQEEFFGIYAYFDQNDEPGIYSQSPDPRRALEPFLEVPSDAQRAERGRLEAEIARATAELELVDPSEVARRAEFDAELARGIDWAEIRVTGAESRAGATLAVLDDGSVLASGANPATDEHVQRLTTSAVGLRLVALEALEDPSLPHGRTGRADNGNAVLTGVVATATSLADPARSRELRFEWAWADFEQENGDYRVVNALDPDDSLGWAVGAHVRPGRRVALLLAAEPFGFEGGTELAVKLQYRSVYPQHALGRVRVRIASVDDATVERLPAAGGGWHHAGPFDGTRDDLFDAEHGPETELALDREKAFGGKTWRFDEKLRDGALNALAAGVNVHYVAKELLVPSAREIEVALGSDDGARVFAGGREIHSNRVDRGLAAAQDRAKLALARGRHLVVFKVVNTGGNAGFHWSEERRERELARDLVAALLPADAVSDELRRRADVAWRTTFSPVYRERAARIAELEGELATLVAGIPRTMVMKDLAAPRETYVLMRGAYDAPDRSRPAKRSVPAALGALPADAPDNRLGLARWLVSRDNPLVARVAANRAWEQIFGDGLVRTSEDFGLQGEWPSHPELLDWLAVELRDTGWDLKRLVERIVTSSTYRQASRARPELRDVDPDQRLLASFPRRRLAAEFVRDQALYVAGLLVERFGGPSVKPYQPDGLWQEVAMVQSNTRAYERGAGEELWRRSLYTYWKRACPPPAMLTLDAPTRESCTIRRTTTNTPVQALALWNDEQFVEAARVLAQRTLVESSDDEDRLQRMFRRCTGRRADAGELALLLDALRDFRGRYAGAEGDARALVDLGEAPRPADASVTELAAWTMLASSLLNLDATICRS